MYVNWFKQCMAHCHQLLIIITASCFTNDVLYVTCTADYKVWLPERFNLPSVRKLTIQGNFSIIFFLFRTEKVNDLTSDQRDQKLLVYTFIYVSLRHYLKQ